MPSSALRDRLVEQLSDHRVPVSLLVVSIVGLVVRLVDLGKRVFYFDEVWFGYWVLKYLDYGDWVYRPILHGPFFARVNAVVFSVLGVSDANGRLVVAVIGGLLPLAAWLYRDHLRDGELVVLGLLLAGNPLLIYYSRFMRKDLPLAAFAFVTLGLVLRARETGRARYLLGAGVSLGLAFTTKESVLLWLVTWLGAGLLVVDRRLLLARRSGGGPLAVLRGWARRIRPAVRRWALSAVGATALFFAVIVLFYAPRGPGRPVGLWRALTGEYHTLPTVIHAATVESFWKAIDYWVTGGIQGHAYLPYLGDTLATLATGATAVCLLGVVGFFYDRYAGESPRAIVGFSFYCGLLATIGYPIANNLAVPWSTLHAVVPLAVPAAVGGYVVYEWGMDRLPAREDGLLTRAPAPAHALRAGLAAAVLSYLVVTMGGVAVQTSFDAPHESPRGDPGHQIVYYAQAPADVREVTNAIRDAAADSDNDTDVLYVGPHLATNESKMERPPETGAWHARNPLQWYTEMYEADVASVENSSKIPETPPPVVITGPNERNATAKRLGDAYTAERQPLDDVGDRVVVVFTKNESTAQ